MPDTRDLDTVNAQIDRALDLVGKLAAGDERWTMSIPAKPDRDTDLILSAALTGAQHALAADHPVIILMAGALRSAEQTCPYHGQDFERLGMWCGEPRCESCQQPYRVVKALEVFEAWQAGGTDAAS